MTRVLAQPASAQVAPIEDAPVMSARRLSAGVLVNRRFGCISVAIAAVMPRAPRDFPLGYQVTLIFMLFLAMPQHRREPVEGWTRLQNYHTGSVMVLPRLIQD